MRVAPWTTPTRYEVAAGPHLVRWKQIPLRHCFRLVSGATPSTTEPEYWDGDIMWVTPDDLGRLGARIIVTSERQITSLGAASIGNRTVPAGSLVLSTRAPIGHLGVAEVSLCTNQGCKSLVPQPDIHVGYAYYQLLARRNELRSLGTGTTFAELSRAQLAAVPFWCPPVGEQRTVADFLDCETDKIDALVAREQRLIELLQEKRTALISHAVTKGLDPDARMKDSGIEWLGEIPVRWIALPLRRGLLGVEQGWSPECGTRPADDQEWGVLKAGCVNHGEFAPGQNKALPSNLTPRAQLEVRAGDVLMSRASGSAELVGSVAYISECRGRLMLSDKVFRLLVDSRRADAKFVALALNSRETRAQIESVLSGSVGLARNIGQPTVRELALCFPPLDEQRDIVRVLEANELSTRMIVSKADDVLERLREYRSALITAAVTGQIDVRTYRREAS